MGETDLQGYFQKFLDTESIFLDKKTLQSNYNPNDVIHREHYINQIAQILAPSLRLDKPSNVFIYGKTGTGKTLSVLHTIDNIEQIAEKETLPIEIVYLNCKLKKIADTEYRIIAQICREVGKEIPPTGLPTEEVYRIFFDALDEKDGVMLLVLDEIDHLVKKTGDEILYNLTRMNNHLKNSQIAIIGISNYIAFADNLDPRVKSSLSEEEIVFAPYNALQLQDILKKRASIAFKEGIVTPGVIEKCAAYAAREHGDARRALELLRVAGELADRTGDQGIEIKHIDLAEDKIERERVIDIIIEQPKQFHATLFAILSCQRGKKGEINTGHVYEIYKVVCSTASLRPLTQRRVSDIIGEFDMLGLIQAKVTSKGRYGRSREISLSISEDLIPKITELLKKDLGIE